MKDKLGLYYHPNPLNKNFRMYVSEQAGEIRFRMWSSEDPKLWEEHDWVPYGAVKKATDMYEGKTIDPRQAYDIEIARALLKEEKKERRTQLKQLPCSRW